MKSKKSLWLSKTLWTNLLIASFAFFWPGGSEWIGDNPQLMASIYLGVNVILRLITKDELQLWAMYFVAFYGASGIGNPL